MLELEKCACVCAEAGGQRLRKKHLAFRPPCKLKAEEASALWYLFLLPGTEGSFYLQAPYYAKFTFTRFSNKKNMCHKPVGERPRNGESPSCSSFACSLFWKCAVKPTALEIIQTSLIPLPRFVTTPSAGCLFRPSKHVECTKKQQRDQCAVFWRSQDFVGQLIVRGCSTGGPKEKQRPECIMWNV